MILLLEFFGDEENSKKGTIKACIALAVMLILNLLWNILFSKYEWSKFFFVYIITWFFIISALGVANPESIEDSAMYGFLVGSTVFIVLHTWLFKFGVHKSWKSGLIEMLVNIGITIIAEVVQYTIYSKYIMN